MNSLEDILASIPGDIPADEKLDPARQQLLLSAINQWQGNDATMPNRVKAALRHCNIKIAEANRIIRELRHRAAFECVPGNYKEFVSAWTRKHDVSFTLDRCLTMEGQERSDVHVYSNLFLDGIEYGFPRSDAMKAAWIMWKEDSYWHHRAKFLDRIAFDKDAPDHWDKVISALIRDDEPNHQAHKLAKAVFQGAVWRIKGKLAGKHDPNHIMPYLRGRQWCGKSQFMNWFLAPVQDGTMNTTFELFTHEERTDALRTTPILFFDEVARADRADAAKVKNMMTTQSTMFRKLYGEATKAMVISTFFGAGNLELEEVITDSTGLRRFFQIDVPHDLWVRLKELEKEGIDPLSLWQSVDENAPSPLTHGDTINNLQAAQQKHVMPTPLESWLIDVCSRRAPSEYKQTDLLYREFWDWKDSRFPTDKTSLAQFQKQLARVLKDQTNGVYEYEHKLDSETRRSVYRLGKMGKPTTVDLLVATRAASSTTSLEAYFH